jgi:putative FmdB family regulatory protein
MPHYDYECEECSHEVHDVKQSMNDKPLVECPQCGKDGLFRVISGGAGVIIKSITTVGQQADFNGKKYKTQLDEAACRKRESEPKKEVPLHHDPKLGGASPQDINKMSPNQKTRYIMEGRK